MTDRRQLRGHQERRSRAEVTTGQRVTGMLTGMSWAATTGASHHQQDNNKHQAGPRGAVTVDNRPGICREEEVEGGCKRGHIHLLYTLSHISPYILLLYLISLRLTYKYKTSHMRCLSYCTLSTCCCTTSHLWFL